MSIITIAIIVTILTAFGCGEVNGQRWLEQHDANRHANDYASSSTRPPRPSVGAFLCAQAIRSIMQRCARDRLARGNIGGPGKVHKPRAHA